MKARDLLGFLIHMNWHATAVNRESFNLSLGRNPEGVSSITKTLAMFGESLEKTGHDELSEMRYVLL